MGDHAGRFKRDIKISVIRNNKIIPWKATFEGIAYVLVLYFHY
jgi:hypothetical protein